METESRQAKGAEEFRHVGRSAADSPPVRFSGRMKPFESSNTTESRDAVPLMIKKSKIYA